MKFNDIPYQRPNMEEVKKYFKDLTKNLEVANSGAEQIKLIEEFARENDRIKYIRFSRNFGRESGILAGFKYASGDAVMVMDGDLQHPPYLIPLFLEAYNEGYDIVSGQRTREGESFVGSSFARLFYFLSNRSMDVHLTDGKSEL